MDKHGTVVIKPVYDYYVFPKFDWFRYTDADVPFNRALFSKMPIVNYGDPFAEGLIIVKYNDKWGFINSEGKIIVEARYDEAFPFRNGRAAVRVGDKWGYIDKNGKMIIAPEYEEAFYFFEDRAWVKKNGKYGFIDNYGNIVLPISYDFYHENTRSFPFREYYGFRDGLACVGVNEKFGYVNTKGEFVIKPIYDSNFDFENGLAIVHTKNHYGEINKKGEYIIKPIYALIFYGFGENNIDAFVYPNVNSIGYMDKNEKVVIPPKFSEASWFLEGMAGVAIEINGNNKWGFINTKGELAIQPIYDEAGDFKNGGAIVGIKEYDEKGEYQKTRTGCIDYNGKYIIPISDTVIIGFYGDVAVYVDYAISLYGLLDTHGNTVTEAKYKYIGPFIDGIAEVYIRNEKKETSFGYINKKGEYVWRPTK
jgi:hypothetical protein